MHIAVLIPSRGRPERLAAAIASMRAKESGAHAVRYVIGCDADDDDTIAAVLDMWRHGLPVVPSVSARQPSLGSMVNVLAAKCPADVYCALADDVEIMTKGWDQVIAAAWEAQPAGVWWWSCRTDTTFAIVSEQWRAAAGRIFTDYFPFWYDDIWLVEVQRYATGQVGVRIDAWLEDRAPGTHRMRDLAFWDEFFWSRRGERRTEALSIASRLGWPIVADLDPLDVGRSTSFDPAAIEAKQGDRRPPTPEYIAALDRAKALMAA